MKKVLFVATVTLHINTFHIPYLKLFKDNGYEVHVASFGEEPIEYCDKHYNIPFERFPLKPKNYKAYKELKKIINENNYEIIHCHTPVGGVLTRLAAKRARKNGTRVIYTAHGFHFYKGAPLLNWIIYYPIEKYLAKHTDTLITINQEDYQLAKNKFNKRCKDIQYVPGVGIDTKKFDIKLTYKEKQELKESIGLEKDDFILTCVARLDKNKNQRFLIEVMEQLVKENNNIHLLLVGPDELNGLFQKNVKKKHLENNVHFLGKREDIPQILAITDIVVSASLREGLPVNVMEAFAAGKPVVALKCRGMEDLIKNNETGFIINNKEDLKEKILNLLNDEKIKVRLIENERKKIDRYIVNNVIEETKRIYNFLK